MCDTSLFVILIQSYCWCRRVTAAASVSRSSPGCCWQKAARRLCSCLATTSNTCCWCFSSPTWSTSASSRVMFDPWMRKAACCYCLRRCLYSEAFLPCPFAQGDNTTWCKNCKHADVSLSAQNSLVVCLPSIKTTASFLEGTQRVSLNTCAAAP
jgi:hypothetical protein